MYNLRYHVASLVAVFLALAVGLLLGTVVAERGMMTDQTNALIADLQQRFDEINATNDQLRLGLERDGAFAEDVVVPLTAERLAGVDVMVMTAPGMESETESILGTINRAGGTVSVARFETRGLGLDRTEPAGLAGYFQFRNVEMAQPGEELQQQVAEALAHEWRSGGEWTLTGLLVGEGLITIESSLGTSTVNAVVVLGDGASTCDPLALAVADEMNSAGAIAVGVDPVPVEDGAAASCAEAGLSAVDHPDTPQGQVSLVWLLAGRAVGHYGFGPAAQAFYPRMGP